MMQEKERRLLESIRNIHYMDEELIKYINVCLEKIDLALEWEKKFEMDLIELSKQGFDLENIKEFESEADNLILMMLSISQSSNQEDESLKIIQSDLRVLYQKVEKNILSCANLNDSESALQRLKAIMEHIQSSLDMDMSLDSQVLSFETQLFQLIEECSKLSQGDIVSATDLKNKISMLMKSITNCKINIKKNSQYDQHILGRIEDIQENLAEFEYTFRKKFNTTTNMEEMTNEFLKSKYLQSVQKEHQILYNDVYEL